MSGLNVTSLDPGALTWETALRLFALRCRSQNLSERTQGLYQTSLRAFRAWIVTQGQPAPAETTAQLLREYLDSIRARGATSSTVDCSYRILRTLFRFLHRDGLILVDPMTRVERPRRERRFVRPFTDEQFRLLLAQIDTGDVLGLRDYALYVFLADTGLRLGEALALRLCDIDWTAMSAVVLGKGRKERRIAFGQAARRSLALWLNRRGTAQPEDALFVNRYGRPMKAWNVEHRMKGYTRAAGIAAARLSPHALRHFFAISYLKNGGDVMTLQKLLGHTSLEMLRNYVNMTDDDALARHREASPLDNLGPLPNERQRVRLK